MEKLKLCDYKIVFWDFDGVIKESVEVKTKAFMKLFIQFGEEVVEKIRVHHINNGGMSRFKKIPIYLQYAGVPTTQANINKYCNRFAEMVETDVVESDWIEGVEAIIRSPRKKDQHFVLVTATPQEEIERILDKLTIRTSFSNIFGAPMSKAEGINCALTEYKVQSENALMIGDSRADYEAALLCGTNFLLRKTPENMVSMPLYKGPWINNFNEYAQQAF